MPDGPVRYVRRPNLKSGHCGFQNRPDGTGCRSDNLDARRDCQSATYLRGIGADDHFDEKAATGAA